MFRMLKQAFDGAEPLCFRGTYDGSVVFLQNRSGNLSPPAELLGAGSTLQPETKFRDSRLSVDLSTDDWPFLYMPRRVYPRSYLIVLGLLSLVSVALYANFFRSRPDATHLPFFFLGAGFMLVETKAITELGLAFGNTWHVIALAISSILMMAFLANALVQRCRFKLSSIAFLLLFASLVFGWWIARAGGFPSSPSGKLLTVAVLTCPLFFSGVVFSALLSKESRISSVMSMNLLGTMLGGILEYNSMYFGFRFLYLLALGLYLAALLTYWLRSHKLAPFPG